MRHTRLLVVAGSGSRFGAPRRAGRAAEWPRSAARRLLAAFGRVWRPEPRLGLSDHLRRDIGLEPLPQPNDLFRPW